MGQIRGGHWLKPQLQNTGYYTIALFLDGLQHTCTIHRLVLEAYCGPCPEGMECRHLDGDRSNYKFENLRWGTRSENRQDQVRHGTSFQGEQNHFAKLTDTGARMIVYMYRTGEFTQQEIAAVYDVTQTCVSSIITKKTWEHIWKG